MRFRPSVSGHTLRRGVHGKLLVTHAGVTLSTSPPMHEIILTANRGPGVIQIGPLSVKIP